MKKPHKYRAIPTVVDNIRFASKKEALRYQQLKLLERAGKIANLELQPKFNLTCGGTPVKIRSQKVPKGRQAYYVGDFRYRTADGTVVVEDVKGMDTPASKLKRAMLEAETGIRIKLT